MIESVLFAIGFAVMLGVAGTFDFNQTGGTLEMLPWFILGGTLMIPKAVWIYQTLKEAKDFDEDDI